MPFEHEPNSARAISTMAISAGWFHILTVAASKSLKVFGGSSS